MAKLLIVDDEPSICWGLERLGQAMGHEVIAVSSAEQALEQAEKDPPDAVVLDVRLPGMDGLTAIQGLRRWIGNAPIIVITAHGDLQTAVEAVRQGASEYVVKPFDLDQMQRVLERALGARGARRAAPAAASPPGGMVGRSAAMQEVFKQIALAAGSDAGVLICGESGTGKELAARAIHRYSRRADGPFVAVNVASLSASLAESELFGHVRGAFTGAERARTGLLAQADGGTLFLDEVADIPLPSQVKLLRAVEFGEVMPVGSGETVRTDFRVISATHQDLPRQVQTGDFRHDLYFRLCTLRIDMPPLGARREDIVALAEHFLAAGRSGDARRPPQLAPETVQELKQRPWYGNVRELRNAVEHAVILSRGGTVLPEHLPPPAEASLVPGRRLAETAEEQLARLVRVWAESRFRQTQEPHALYEQLLRIVEAPLLHAAMAENRGQYSAAARCLGMHRTTLRKKLDQYGTE